MKKRIVLFTIMIIVFINVFNAQIQWSNEFNSKGLIILSKTKTHIIYSDNLSTIGYGMNEKEFPELSVYDIKKNTSTKYKLKIPDYGSEGKTFLYKVIKLGDKLAMIDHHISTNNYTTFYMHEIDQTNCSIGKAIELFKKPNTMKYKKAITKNEYGLSIMFSTNNEHMLIELTPRKNNTYLRNHKYSNYLIINKQLEISDIFDDTIPNSYYDTVNFALRNLNEFIDNNGQFHRISDEFIFKSNQYPLNIINQHKIFNENMENKIMKYHHGKIFNESSFFNKSGVIPYDFEVECKNNDIYIIGYYINYIKPKKEVAMEMIKKNINETINKRGIFLTVIDATTYEVKKRIIYDFQEDDLKKFFGNNFSSYGKSIDISFYSFKNKKIHISNDYVFLITEYEGVSSNCNAIENKDIFIARFNIRDDNDVQIFRISKNQMSTQPLSENSKHLFSPDPYYYSSSYISELIDDNLYFFYYDNPENIKIDQSEQNPTPLRKLKEAAFVSAYISENGDIRKKILIEKPESFYPFFVNNNSVFFKAIYNNTIRIGILNLF